ncbi:hypothetical protein L21SP5_01589 [Salinivirga cyanobacteriivorans]|uniref:Uncharacterized protein n=1 Tax=Salinivirga cyanobacteriivorans TaxID=1307839 RepID=A0A0S2HYR5_9BACT|nr:hypothetical protein L21SP5_01589 [Salinivirga cyanobacteriivorans]
MTSCLNVYNFQFSVMAFYYLVKLANDKSTNEDNNDA